MDLAAAEAEVGRVDWSVMPRVMGWRQGEHVALVGPTGAGKTSAALTLAQLRRYVALMSTKPKDSTIDHLRRQGWSVIPAWPPAATVTRVVVKAPLVNLRTDGPKVGAVIADALQGAYSAGSWCVILDDLQALMDTCGIARTCRLLLTNARSVGVSVVASTQRPRWVPREVWTQSTHLFIWRCTDADDLRALSGLGSADTATVRRAVAALDFRGYEVLYVNTRTGRLAVTVFPNPKDHTR